MSDVYYRYVDELVGTGGFDIDGDYIPGPAYVRVRVVTLKVDKKTPKGAWVLHPSEVDGAVRRHFICDAWHRKYANPTLEGAQVDFIKRKRRLIDIQTRRIRHAEEAIALAIAGQERSMYRKPIEVLK